MEPQTQAMCSMLAMLRARAPVQASQQGGRERAKKHTPQKTKKQKFRAYARRKSLKVAFAHTREETIICLA